MRKDIYKSKDLFEKWKKDVTKNGIEDLNKLHSDLVYNYVCDMEQGRNISRGTKKGGRSYLRLNTLKNKVSFVLRLLEKRNVRDIRKLKEKEIVSLFDDMSKGRISRNDGTSYKSCADYVKDFKSFWSWLSRIEKKKDNVLEDITLDLDSSKPENSFVYFTFPELQKMMKSFTPDEQVRLLFMFDTIIRSPTELMNVKVSDLSRDFKELSIREETAKTYGRTIKLLLCSSELEDYVKRKKLSEDSYLFDFSPAYFNRKLQRVALKVFGDKNTKGGKMYKEITMYDLRHCGACYWRLGAYRSKIDALMYRGGWNNLDMLNYYTKKLGMKDSIEKDDLLIGVDKNALEKQIEELREQNEDLYKKFAELGNTVLNLDKNGIEYLGKVPNEQLSKRKNKIF